jgi:hypothetical protein
MSVGTWRKNNRGGSLSVGLMLDADDGFALNFFG